jgi:hypothetical protein
LLLAVTAQTAYGLETDQYWAWGWELADSTAAVNAKLNIELGVPVAQANVGRGLLVRVGGGDGRQRTVTGGVGWGF